MTSFAQDMLDVLESAGVGQLAATEGWALHVSREPEAPPAPVTTVTLYDTGQHAAPLTHLPDANPTLQARIRAADYSDGHAKAVQVRETFVGLPGFAKDGRVYQAVFVTADVAPIGRDDQDRYLFTVNFGAVVALPDQVNRQSTPNRL